MFPNSMGYIRVNCSAGIILDPGPNCRWLIYVLTPIRVFVYIACVAVKHTDTIHLFGKGSSGVEVLVKEIQPFPGLLSHFWPSTIF